MLARLIAQAEAEVRQAKDEYATLLQNNDHRATVQQIRNYYDEFLGWANEFDLAAVPRKRAILAELFEKVEVGRGYKVTMYTVVNSRVYDPANTVSTPIWRTAMIVVNVLLAVLLVVLEVLTFKSYKKKKAQ